MKTLKIFFVLLLFLIVACKSKENSVNRYRVFPLLPNSTGEAMEEGRNRPGLVAISGKVLLRGEVPVPLQAINLALYKFSTSKEEKILDLSSGSQGVFNIARELDKGNYELRVTDQRYKGSLKLTVDKPIEDIIFEVEKRN